jgi:hypothetical protein
MYESDVKNKPLLKFLKKQTCEWRGESISNTGDLFRIYHDIMVLRGEGCYKAICEKHWQTFFPIHIVPAFIIVTDGVFEIDYQETAKQILDACVKQLCSELSN